MMLSLIAGGFLEMELCFGKCFNLLHLNLENAVRLQY